MKIDVRGLLGSAGEQRTLELSLPVSTATGQDDVRFAPAAVHLVLTATPEGILAIGQVKAVAHLECSRCLAAFDLPVDGQLEHLFVSTAPPASGSPAAGIDRVMRAGAVDDREWSEADALRDEDFDISPVQDGMIDIGPLVREVLELALPMKPICREDCLGLCPVCGRPLSEGECDCDTAVTDPRLAAFAALDLSKERDKKE